MKKAKTKRVQLSRVNSFANQLAQFSYNVTTSRMVQSVRASRLPTKAEIETAFKS